jgi:Kdo2-lipid IVA lauroyltransferase/acyltransferase
MIFATSRLILIFLCRLLGLLAFYLFRSRKEIALENLSRSLSFSKKETLRIARQCFIHQGQTCADFLLLRFFSKKNIKQFVTLKNEHYVEESLRKKNGVIISTGHFGSWELAAHAMALAGYQSMIPYNPVKKFPRLDDFIKKQRGSGGNILIPKQNSLIKIYQHLKNKKIISILVDQYCIPEQGLQVPFFGQQPWTHTSFIKLSLKLGTPIVPGFMLTHDLSSYTLEFLPPLNPEDFRSAQDPVSEMALAHNRILEKTIRRAPELWMWQHRRFKNC